MSFATVYSLIKQKIRGELKSRTRDNTSSIGFFIHYNEGGIKCLHKSYYPCYGWSGKAEYQPSNIMFFATHIHERVLDEEVERAWITYIRNSSPYRGTILNDTEEIIKHRIVVADATTKNSNIVYPALFAIRMLYERPMMVQFWYDIVGRGVPWNIAFLMLHSFSWNFDGMHYSLVGAQILLAPGTALGGDHMVLNLSHRPATYLRRFLDVEYIILEPPIVGLRNGIANVWNLFGEDSTGWDSTNSFIYKFWKRKLAPANSNNPFSSGFSLGLPRATYQEAVELCVQHHEDFRNSIYA